MLTRVKFKNECPNTNDLMADTGLAGVAVGTDGDFSLDCKAVYQPRDD